VWPPTLSRCLGILGALPDWLLTRGVPTCPVFSCFGSWIAGPPSCYTWNGPGRRCRNSSAARCLLSRRPRWPPPGPTPSGRRRRVGRPSLRRRRGNEPAAAATQLAQVARLRALALAEAPQPANLQALHLDGSRFRAGAALALRRHFGHRVHF